MSMATENKNDTYKILARLVSPPQDLFFDVYVSMGNVIFFLGWGGWGHTAHLAT